MLQIFLPRERQCSLAFLQAILANRKQFYQKNNIRNLRVPLWNELSLDNQWPQAIQLPGFVDHMPDDWIGDGKGPRKRRERQYFWAILVTQAPQYVEELIKDCRQQRMQQQQNRINRPQALAVAANWVEPLLSQPFIPGKQFISYAIIHTFYSSPTRFKFRSTLINFISVS